MSVEKHTMKLFKNMLQKLKPPENITVSEWADRYRYLSPESSAEPGKWKTNRTPYLRKIMDAVSDPAIRKVVVMSSAQVGKSEILLNSMGYCIDINPSTILLVQPTSDLGKNFSKERIAPMIRDTPRLSKLIGSDNKRDSDNTILQKSFPGGYIAIVGANSPTGLASRPIRVLAADEIDRWPHSAGKEGDPLTLAEKRTTTFPYNNKKIYTSTPTIDEISRIQHEFKQGTMEKWKLPCPACGEYQEIIWGNIQYQTDKETDKLIEDAEILHVCESCGELSNEYSWKIGSKNGKWFPQNENAEIKSFQLSSLVSPWKSWSDIVKSYLVAKDDDEMHKVWTNTELGEVWQEKGDRIDENDLILRKEYYSTEVPEEVLAVTAGVDVQDNRFELEIVGWGEGNKSWGLEYIVVRGNTALDETWDRLDQHLLKKYTSPDGTVMPISVACIDSGGHRTTECYKFCKVRESRGVYAIKGRGGAGIGIIHTVTRTRKVKNALVILGVDTAKSTLFSHLEVQDKNKPYYCHFPADEWRKYDETYFKGLTSEVKVTRMVRGRPKVEWVKKVGVNNEQLDCRVYNLAALEILSPNFEELKKRRGRKSIPRRKRKGSKGVTLND